MTSPQNDAALQDELTFERLIETIAASKGMSALLVAVSDDPFQEETIVRRCEVELLQQEGIHTVEVQLARRDPSMRAAIERALTTAPHVRAGRPSVLMVRGAGGLSGLNLQAEDDSPTEIDRFFGYLQWTREAIGQIPYPIVLWLTPRLYKQMAKRAPDFWSWRRGTFQFRQRTPVETGPVRSPDFLGQIARDDSDDDSILSDDSDDDSILSLEDLQAAITANTNNRPRLARLWNQLGRRYQRDYNNYPESIVACEQALQIARELDDQYEKAYALNWLGNAYNSLGEYQQAIDFHEQSLEIRRAISDHKGEAGSLGNLGNTYKSLGEYQQSIDFYEQSLAIFRTISDRYGEAYALNNLGNTYKSLGEYQRSIDFYEQSLAIFRTIGDHYGEAYALNGLGNAYYSLGEYQRAIDFYEQSLAIFRTIGDRRGEANSLNNLGNAYNSLGEHQRAIDFHEQSLAIK
jgi:tetratricopeptide (TPR) repeat protein